MTPHRRKLAVAILIWALGALPLAVTAVQVVLAVFTPLHGFTAPGSIRSELRRDDEQAVLLQTRGSDLGTIKSADVRPSDLDCVARTADGRRTVRARPIDPYTLTRNEDVYVAKVGFTAPARGHYVVWCGLRTATADIAPLALSDRVHVGRLFVQGFAALAICAATIMGGVVVVRRARRERDRPTRP